jgi:hypothetical protein
MSKVETDDGIMFACQSFEVGENAPYENVDLLVNNGTRHQKPPEGSKE